MKSTDVASILKIIRPYIVVGGVLAFLLGALLAVAGGGTIDLTRFAMFYMIVFFGDLSTHYSNDYFDVQVDKHAKKRKFFSGSNILVNNPTFRPIARTISITFLILSIVLASFAVLFRIGPIELLLITLAANFLGWFYSAPPIRLASRGLGEVAIALAVGIAIPALGYLSVNGWFDFGFGYFVLPFMLYGFMLGLSLEAPDIEFDWKGGKRSIGVRKGERFVFGLVLAVTMAASLLFLFYAWQVAGVIDFRLVTAFSILPLTAGLFGVARVFQNSTVNQVSTVNVVSLFLFNILMITYLAVLCYL
jgi:1,4-dihydroxy-2-naphthoate polyprenyltransferase